MTQTRNQLIALLTKRPNDAGIAQMVAALEADQPADLDRDGALLKGVWELRWSSSKQPWLKQAPWLDNLQVLDPDHHRGCNLLRLSGAFGNLAAIRVDAELTTGSNSRVEVQFRRGGWLGPQLPGGRRLQLIRQVEQKFPAWLEITVLDQTLRICRGNAGTLFALLRRPDLSVADFF